MHRNDNPDSVQPDINGIEPDIVHNKRYSVGVMVI